MSKYIKLIFIFAMCFLFVYSSNLIAAKYSKILPENLETIFISKYIPTNSKIVRIEIEIFDDTSKNYYDIIDVEFNNKKIDLLKANASGQRARKYFQLKPGKYLIKWKISKSDPVQWPNYETFQRTVILKDTDTYFHILIRGSNITTS